MTPLDDLGEPSRKCERCGSTDLYFSRYCGATICHPCGYHLGLVRCYCGWAADGGDGRRQLQDLGETLEEDE